MDWIKRHIFLLGIIVIILLIISYFVYEQLRTDSTIARLNNPDAVAAQSAMSGSDIAKGDSSQNETQRNPLETYKVAADQPRALYIPSINIAARIKPVGLTNGTSINAPTNIYDAGWFTGSVKPGEVGATFIDGHASGSTRMGLFAYLDTLEPEDEVNVEMGDGARHTYRVKAVEVVSKEAVDMDKVLTPHGTAEKGLNLMTCTGKWIQAEKTYDQRVIVYTEKLS